MGNYYFLWKVSDEDSRDVQLTHTARQTAKIKEEIPVYHTRETKREFKLKFGAVANAKPVYLREMYRQLTQDASAPENTATAQ